MSEDPLVTSDEAMHVSEETWGQVHRLMSDDGPVALPDGWSWGRRPRLHGSWDIGLPVPVLGDRRILEIPGRLWPFEPEACQHDSIFGEWVLDGRVLVCPGCGLDST